MTPEATITRQNRQTVEQLRLKVRAFIREHVIPAEPRPGEELDGDTLQRLQEAAKAAGVFAPHLGVEFGGQGLSIEHWSPVFQEAGYSPIGPSVLNCMAPDEGNMHMLELIATQEQKERFLVPLAHGRTRSCFGMTEPHPGAGSDPAALMATARRENDRWILNGHKRFSSGAHGAGFCIFMAEAEATDSTASGATMFLVDLDHPGVRIGESIHTIDRAIVGGHPHLYFEDVTVTDDAVLGEVGRGNEYAQVRLGPARLTHCMRWLGLARRSLDIALDRAERRELFGAELYTLGLAQELIAQCEIDIETSDAIITKTALLLEQDFKKGSNMSSIAKVYCSEAVNRVIDRCIQICGGDGVSDGLPLAQYLNEVRPFRIYDGSTETHKFAISRRASSRRRKEVQAGALYQGEAVIRPAQAGGEN